MTGRANRCHHAKGSDSLFLKNVSTTKLRCSPDQSMASSENGKIVATQRDHSHHCIPFTTRAVTPPKVGVISVTPCRSFCLLINYRLQRRHRVDSTHCLNILNTIVISIQQYKQPTRCNNNNNFIINFN